MLELTEQNGCAFGHEINSTRTFWAGRERALDAAVLPSPVEEVIASARDWQAVDGQALREWSWLGGAGLAFGIAMHRPTLCHALSWLGDDDGNMEVTTTKLPGMRSPGGEAAKRQGVLLLRTPERVVLVAPLDDDSMSQTTGTLHVFGEPTPHKAAGPPVAVLHFDAHGHGPAARWLQMKAHNVGPEPAASITVSGAIDGGLYVAADDLREIAWQAIVLADWLEGKQAEVQR